MLDCMNSGMKKWAATAAIVLSAAVTLSACGDDEEPASGSGSASAEVGDAADELTAETFMTAVSGAQAKAGSSHVDMTVDAAGQKITAKGDVVIGDDPADTAMTMTMDAGAAAGGLGSLEMRLVDGTFYMNLGPLTQDKFAKVDLDDPSNPLGAQYGQLVDQLDPSRQIEQFNDALKSFDQKGEPLEIDGVEATPYVLTLDTTKIPGTEDGATAGMPETIEYTMYIGPDNLPRRISSDIAGSAFTMDYSKWGEDIKVEAPSDDEITDTDLMSQLAGA